MCEVINKRDREDGGAAAFGDEDEGLMYSLLKVVALAMESSSASKDSINPNPPTTAGPGALAGGQCPGRRRHL